MRGSDPAVVRDKYFLTKQDLDSKMKQMIAIERNCKLLEKDLSHRRKKWRQFCSHIAEMTNPSFDKFLNRKGSTGEVQFNHEGGKLNLVVQKVYLLI